MPPKTGDPGQAPGPPAGPVPPPGLAPPQGPAPPSRPVPSQGRVSSPQAGSQAGSPRPPPPGPSRIRIIKKFQNYRGDPEQTAKQIRDTWRRLDYVIPAAVAPSAPVVNQFPRRQSRGRADPYDPDTEAFLQQIPSELEDVNQVIFGGGPDSWIGVKLLGEGSYGKVGLWEYMHNDRKPGQLYHQVAVKEAISNDPSESLDYDNQIYQTLLKTGSAHVSQILAPGKPVDAAAEGLDMVWDGKITRLIMEYCTFGDLNGLIKTFQRLGRPMREITVWRIFECLIDGLSALHFGNELTLVAPGNIYQSRTLPGWDPIIHFDLKPGNKMAVLMAEDRSIHGASPVVKIADFGLCKGLSTFTNWGERWDVRRLATEGYFAPEQFSASWEAKDFKTSGIAGRYNFKTNVWGIGCIMYQLMLLTNNPPDAKVPFRPTFAASWYTNAPALRGRAFGHLLKGGLPPTAGSPVYSNELIDLVQLCLMEHPLDRPILRDLRSRIRAGILASIAAGSVDEPWEYFTPALPTPEGSKALCIGRELDATPCIRKAAPNGGGYCTKHQDQRLTRPSQRKRRRR